MTNQEKKDYLRRYRAADEAINDLLLEKEEVMSRLCRMTAAPSGMPHGYGESDRVTPGIDRVIELEGEIDRQVDELYATRQYIQSCINQIRREDCRRVLELRYLRGLKWDTVADIMHYDPEAKKIYGLHSRALSLLELDTVRH